MALTKKSLNRGVLCPNTRLVCSDLSHYNAHYCGRQEALEQCLKRVSANEGSYMCRQRWSFSNPANVTLLNHLQSYQKKNVRTWQTNRRKFLRSAYCLQALRQSWTQRRTIHLLECLGVLQEQSAMHKSNDE